MKKIAVLNGPNLGRLGKREPEVYGNKTLLDMEKGIRKKFPQIEFDFFQSNHEGEIVDRIEYYADNGFEGIVINPGGLTHTSVVLRDAIKGAGIECVEVHISNVYKREEFRKHSYISPIAKAVISGCGFDGYLFAVQCFE